MAGDERPIQGIDASGEQVDVWKTCRFTSNFSSEQLDAVRKAALANSYRWGYVSVPKRRPNGRPSALRAGAIRLACLCTRRHRMFTISRVGRWIRGHSCQICQEARDRSMPILVSFIERQAVRHLSLLIRQLTMT